VLEYIRAVNAFPFEVASDLGMKKHLNKDTICHNKLGDQVDIPVTIVTELLRRLDSRAEFLPQIGQVKRCCFTTIVSVSV
jgi:hypothetical protein